MWICENCGEEFMEPDHEAVKEIHTEIDAPNVETRYLARCPYCGSSRIEEGYACEFCGESVATIDGYCKHCIEDAGNAIEEWGKKKNKDWKTTKDLFLAWAERNW